MTESQPPQLIAVSAGANPRRVRDKKGKRKLLIKKLGLSFYLAGAGSPQSAFIQSSAKGPAHLLDNQGDNILGGRKSKVEPAMMIGEIAGLTL